MPVVLGGLMRIVAIEHVTLDGVMQAPGRPDEDLRDGFHRGGWASVAADDPRRGLGDGSSHGRQRRSAARTSNLRGPPRLLERPGRLVQGGAEQRAEVRCLHDPRRTAALAELDPDRHRHRRRSRSAPSSAGRELHVLGSGDLLRTLLRHRLVDELLLLLHPIALGHGQRLFDDGVDARFDLIEARPTTSGVIIARYETAPV